MWRAVLVVGKVNWESYWVQEISSVAEIWGLWSESAFPEAFLFLDLVCQRSLVDSEKVNFFGCGRFGCGEPNEVSHWIQSKVLYVSSHCNWMDWSILFAWWYKSFMDLTVRSSLTLETWGLRWCKKVSCKSSPSKSRLISFVYSVATCKGVN